MTGQAVDFTAPVDLVGVSGAWVWATMSSPTVDARPVLTGSIPVGIALDHGDHRCLVAWAESPAHGVVVPFTLDSLMPLTVREPVSCSLCAVTGRISAGTWVPALEGGVERG